MQAVSGKLLQAKSRLQISNSFTPIDGGATLTFKLATRPHNGCCGGTAAASGSRTAAATAGGPEC